MNTVHLSKRVLNSFTGQFELTPHCNFNCKICYIHDYKEAGRVTLPASFWLDKARQAADQGMLVLSLTGGETLLYPELDQLMEGLEKIGLLISFNTNSILVDEKRVEWFLKYCPHKINISLYGVTNETYEKFCGIKNGFTRVAKAIDMLQEAGLNVYLNGMLTPDNVHELSQMHLFASERNLVLHTSSYAFPFRTQPGQNVRGQYRFTPEEAAEASVRYSVIQYGPENFRRMGANSLLDIKLRREHNICDNCIECNGGVSNFQISYDGFLHPCAMYQQIAVSLEEYSFVDAWQLVSQKMRSIPYPDKCNACDRKGICPVCKAAVFLETGNTTEAPEYLCRYSQAFEDILREECAGVRISLQHSGNLNSHHCEF